MQSAHRRRSRNSRERSESGAATVSAAERIGGCHAREEAPGSRRRLKLELSAANYVSNNVGDQPIRAQIRAGGTRRQRTAGASRPANRAQKRGNNGSDQQNTGGNTDGGTESVTVRT